MEDADKIYINLFLYHLMLSHKQDLYLEKEGEYKIKKTEEDSETLCRNLNKPKLQESFITNTATPDISVSQTVELHIYLPQSPAA